jgi:hypothetical protein
MGSEYFFLKSKRDGDVIDVKDEKTAARTPLIAYPQKSQGTDNQLWGFIVSDAPPYFFITVKQTGQVIDIKEADQTAGAPLIAFPQKGSGAYNQLWILVPSDETATYFFITSQLNRGVITIEGPRQATGTPLVARPRKPTDNDDQLWSVVPAG